MEASARGRGRGGQKKKTSDLDDDQRKKLEKVLLQCARDVDAARADADTRGKSTMGGRSDDAGAMGGGIEEGGRALEEKAPPRPSPRTETAQMA
eukprot:4040559-Pyramimonas_sp.AAC.1